MKSNSRTKIDLARCDLFNACLNRCKLLDLGFQGPFYTWTNKRDGGALIRERLDRSVAILEWRLQFSDAMVYHLPRTHSDHHPILTDCMGMYNTPEVRPFWFEFAWFTHSKCLDLIVNTWA